MDYAFGNWQYNQSNQNNYEEIEELEDNVSMEEEAGSEVTD